MRFRLKTMLALSFATFSVNAQMDIRNDSSNLELVHKYLTFRPEFEYKVKSTQQFNVFDAKKLPFFCKIEHLIENKSKIALRFRLGDLNYVNMLENKR